MYLYLYHNEQRNNMQQGVENQRKLSEQSELLARKALKDYVHKKQLPINDRELEQITILRGEKGKPYFSGFHGEGLNELKTIHYSVSHSGSWWGCLMAEEAVGFDLEVCREKVNYSKIAKRFFTEEEYEYVLSTGLEGFFELWVRKEAFVKYLGSGLAAGLDSFSVVDKGCLSKQILEKKEAGRMQSAVFINACEISDEVKAAYCSNSGSFIQNIISL